MSSLVPVVEQVVNDKVQQGEMFTAHDVTLEVRGRGHRAGHAEIRTAVHDYFQRGGMGVAYTRSTITVPGGTPFLYHRLVDDPSTFANIRGLNTNVPTSATIAVPPPSAIVNDGDDEDEDEDEDEDDGDSGLGINLPPNLLGNLSVAGVAVQPAVGVQKAASNKPGQVNSRQVDDRGTLSIPTNLVRGAGLRTYQKVYAFSNGSGTLVVDATKPAAGVVHEYTVDSHDQVRVTQKCLQDAGIPGKSYNLELNANSQILVKAS
jgi:hypothetical protein